MPLSATVSLQTPPRLEKHSPSVSTSVSAQESLPPSLPLRECLPNDLPTSLSPCKCCLWRCLCRCPCGAVSVESSNAMEALSNRAMESKHRQPEAAKACMY
jgi:hypothetical protein